MNAPIERNWCLFIFPSVILSTQNSILKSQVFLFLIQIYFNIFEFVSRSKLYYIQIGRNFGISSAPCSFLINRIFQYIPRTFQIFKYSTSFLYHFCLPHPSLHVSKTQSTFVRFLLSHSVVVVFDMNSNGKMSQMSNDLFLRTILLRDVRLSIQFEHTHHPHTQIYTNFKCIQTYHVHVTYMH